MQYNRKRHGFGDKSANYMQSWTHLLSLFAHLNPQSCDFGDICASSSPFLVVPCVPVVVCVARKLRPCLSYSRRRGRINSVLLCRLDKGGGGGCGTAPLFVCAQGIQHPLGHRWGPRGASWKGIGGPGKGRNLQQNRGRQNQGQRHGHSAA